MNEKKYSKEMVLFLSWRAVYLCHLTLEKLTQARRRAAFSVTSTAGGL
jgi:hypothetical protein